MYYDVITSSINKVIKECYQLFDNNGMIIDTKIIYMDGTHDSSDMDGPIRISIPFLTNRVVCRSHSLGNLRDGYDLYFILADGVVIRFSDGANSLKEWEGYQIYTFSEWAKTIAFYSRANEFIVLKENEHYKTLYIRGFDRSSLLVEIFESPRPIQKLHINIIEYTPGDIEFSDMETLLTAHVDEWFYMQIIDPPKNYLDYTKKLADVHPISETTKQLLKLVEDDEVEVSEPRTTLHVLSLFDGGILIINSLDGRTQKLVSVNEVISKHLEYLGNCYIDHDIKEQLIEVSSFSHYDVSEIEVSQWSVDIFSAYVRELGNEPVLFSSSKGYLCLFGTFSEIVSGKVSILKKTNVDIGIY